MMSKSWINESGLDPDDLILVARAADQAERYDDMAAAMKLYTESKAHTELASEHRNYLSVAYKNVVGSRRASYRVLCSWIKEASEKEAGSNIKKEILEKYQALVVGELTMVCNEVLKLLDDYLIPNASTPESKVFYYKMQGDYYRYLAEVAEPSDHERVVNGSLNAYKEATSIAASLVHTNPIKLGLALNFSVFYYEIMNLHDEARKIADGAFNDALLELDRMDEDSYKDSTLIMQLLRDNLTLWTGGENENQAEGDLE